MGLHFVVLRSSLAPVLFGMRIERPGRVEMRWCIVWGTLIVEAAPATPPPRASLAPSDSPCYPTRCTAAPFVAALTLILGVRWNLALPSTSYMLRMHRTLGLSDLKMLRVTLDMTLASPLNVLRVNWAWTMAMASPFDMVRRRSVLLCGYWRWGWG